MKSRTAELEKELLESRRDFLRTFAPDSEEFWSEVSVLGDPYPCYSREFWTSRQRQASNLHEVSYRACYKPQLPRLFIEQLTQPGDIVYDPFSGRGTTIIEAALLGRKIIANDINPLSTILAKSRLNPPTLENVMERLKQIPRINHDVCEFDLSMFFHPETENEIKALRNYLLKKIKNKSNDVIDDWIQMVSTNRLTGHSSGFFSVYTLPPNQAVTSGQQIVINKKRKQKPEYRDTHKLIIKKTKQLISSLTDLERKNLTHASKSAQFYTFDARKTKSIKNNIINLTVTSPPFLDVVQYANDNWLRCWFCGLDAEKIGRGLTMSKTIEAWKIVMTGVFHEIYRITKRGGYVAFEVGEIRKGTLRLEEEVLPIGIGAGFKAKGILINQQEFTKTAHIWGISNNTGGTNSNRIVLFQKI